MNILPSQADVCGRFKVQPILPLDHDRLGIAMSTLHLNLINGMRIPALSGLSGWFIFGGSDASEAEDFYSPLCVRHIAKHCDLAVPYLCLPPGWRFQIDSNGYEDVWYDELLLRPRD